jgi:hypothetical protein
MWRKNVTNNIGGSLKKVFWIPVAYILFFAVLLLIVWPQLDKPAIIAVVSVLGGGLAGVVGSFVGAIIALQRVEKESETKIKEYASSQALELTKLELELRQKEGRQKQLLAAAKIYREFYKALFEHKPHIMEERIGFLRKLFSTSTPIDVMRADIFMEYHHLT